MTAVIGANRVHPRIRARRIAVERDQGRRRRRWLVLVAVLLLLAAAAAVLLQSSLMDVDRVEVLGTERTSPDAVLDAAGISPGSSLLTLDLGTARESVARLPWVDEVRATADLSGDVVLELTERQPVAQVATPTGYSVVDSEGRVVSFTAESDPGLATISGINGAGAGSWLGPEALESIGVAAALGPRLQPHVAAVSWEPNAEIFLELSRGGRVRIGDSRDLEAKMIALETLIDQVEMACVGVIDVRAATAPVITRAC